MSKADDVTLIICVTLVAILCAGKPDLLDAIIALIGRL